MKKITSFFFSKRERGKLQEMVGKSEQCNLLSGDKEKKDGGIGKGRRYNHGFSSVEIQTLASVNEAVFPSLSPNTDFEGMETQPSKAVPVQAFLEASASESPFPDEVKKKLSGTLTSNLRLVGVIGPLRSNAKTEDILSFFFTWFLKHAGHVYTGV